MVFRDSPHGIAYLKSNATPDSGVYFIENECGYPVEPRKNCLERQHDSRHFATRSYARQRPRIMANIHGDPEFDVLVAGRTDNISW